MLAVFEKTVANSPEELQSPHSTVPAYALKEGYLASRFSGKHPNSVVLNLGSSGLLAYALDNNDPRVPRLKSTSLLSYYVLDLVNLRLFPCF